MTGNLGADRIVRGDTGRKLNNALTLSFGVGEGAQIATALQGGADGAGGKMGVLFGFKNGGTGTHVLTISDGTGADGAGRVLHVKSQAVPTTIVTTADGAPVAEVLRADSPTTSTVRLASGQTAFTVAEDTEAPDHGDAFRMLLLDPDGQKFGRVDLIRRTGGWTLTRDLVDDVIWFGHAGQPLKVPFLGTLLTFDRDPTTTELDLCLAICVDMALGVRGYFHGMG